MAEVWLAHDAELDRRVVVKLLALRADRARFEREARAVAGLAHPNIVQLFDFGEERQPYMVFEYLPGGTLEDRLAGNAMLAGDEIARLAGDVAQGLAHAHERGVVHRDLKPGNILFDGEGRAKIADFGIARVQGVDTLTDAGTILGTAAYISPEQVRGEPVTAGSDVYAFGVILYRLLAGRLPFEGSSATELARLHRDVEPPPLSRSGALPALALAALAKEPARRPADGTALVRALEGAGPAADPGTTEILPPAGLRRRLGRRRLIVGVAVALLALLGALAAVLLAGRPASAPAVPVHTPSPSPHTATTPQVTTAPSKTTTPATTRTTAPAPTTAATTRTAPQFTTVPSVPTTTIVTTAPPATTAATVTGP